MRPGSYRPGLLLLPAALVVVLTSCSDGDGSAAEQPTSASSSTSSPASSAPPDVPDASGLEAVAGCEGKSNHVADFTWEPADPPGESQRLILSYSQEGLHTHDLIPTGELDPGQSTYHWVGLAAGTEPRYWAVLTFRDGTSSASEDATFPGVACPGDSSSGG